MTVLIIDNYDSFVYNLARYVEELGFHTMVVRNDAITLKEMEALAPSHLILSPGPCTPNEAGICLSAILHFYQTIPLLGICLGHQAIAQALGGNVIRATRPMHGKNCLIQHTDTGIFQGLPNPLRVGRYHSLVACPNTLPPCLETTAVDEIGEIMALAHTQAPTFGVQFHPESILTDSGHALLQKFLAH